MDLVMETGPSPAGPINPYAAPQTPADMASVVGPAAHDLTREEVEAFVGNKHSYYWRRWRRAVGGRVRAGFNWAAFFFNFVWLLYRKMYREFFILVAAVFGVGVLHGLVQSLTGRNLDVVDKLTNIVVGVAIGMYGNSLYLRRARREIGKARTQELDPERRAALLRARGGTSWIALLLGIALLGGLTVLSANVR
jgi:hypothetical protein